MFSLFKKRDKLNMRFSLALTKDERQLISDLATDECCSENSIIRKSLKQYRQSKGRENDIKMPPDV